MEICTLLRDDDSFVVPVNQEWLGHWCRITVYFPSDFRPKIVTIRSETVDRDPDADTYYLDHGRIGRGSRFRPAIAFVPATASNLRLSTFGHGSPAASLTVNVTPLRKWSAAIALALRRPADMLGALKGGLRGIGRRVRTTLAIVSTGRPPPSYDLWTRLFDDWTDRRIASLLASDRKESWPSIEVRVCPGSGRMPSALAATLASVERQVLPVSSDAPHADYVAVVQAGEVVPGHAMALLADWIVRLDWPDAIYADEDRITDVGDRHAPLFKPEPNHTLMLSGTLSTGIWLIRRSCLAELPSPADQWAAAIRLETWLRLHERDRAHKTHRVPYILTHRRDDCEPEPAAVLAPLVEAHLRRLAVSALIEPTWPIQVQPLQPEGHETHVTIVVPSACRAPHVVQCLLAVATRTSYPSFDVVVVVSQQSGPDTLQKQMIAKLEANPHIKVVHHRITGGFNYSAANNHAVGIVTGSLICLLNDDVEPIGADWLTKMVGHFTDPVVGIVGAKLYYPNNRVQHGGVIIGLAGLCDHMNRLLPKGAPGYAYRGVLDQQLSAVTAACLLIERTLYETVGGMDERYASAFNDVDLCLKVGAAGRSVIYSAQTELYHYESMSYVQHYSEAEIERWARDVGSMRASWQDIVGNDPFHNPNLSLQRGNEWAVAFPPRLEQPATGLS